MRGYDAHNHLHDARFGGRQAELLAACRAAGIERMVVNGSCEEDWPAVAELARSHPDLVIPAFGLHPWYVHERSTGWRETLERFLDTTPGATIGEIGLDRWILECPPPARVAVAPELASRTAAGLEEQTVVFREQLEMAARRGVVASVHCLQAWGAMFEVLRAGPVPAPGFLLHSYGGPAEMVRPLARLGAYFGFPGYFLHERKARQRETFRGVPPDRLLIETDAPDQRLPGAAELARVVGEAVAEEDVLGPSPGSAPVNAIPPFASRDSPFAVPWPAREITGHDGRALNHPANLPVIRRGLARVLRVPEEALAARLEENFARLFGRLSPG